MNKEKIILKDYKLSNITTNFDKLQKGEISISINTQINVMFPKAEENKNIGVKVDVEFTNTDTKDLIAKFSNIGFFDTSEADADVKESIDENLQKLAVEIMYEKTRELIKQVFILSNVTSVDMPPFDELIKR